jgi:hypothetical protein
MGKISAMDRVGAQPTRPHPGGQFAARLKQRKNRMCGPKKRLQSGVASGK